MTDPNPVEQAAMDYAGSMAGELIESYTTTDMAQWEPEQWLEFIAVTCSAYVDYIVTKNSEAAEALGKVAATLP